MVVFVIVNNKCDVIYELDLSENTDELSYLHQFILHASLGNKLQFHTLVYLIFHSSIK